ncbi:TetR/AcrR family transcriptional regulator [Telluribacter humicola]
MDDIAREIGISKKTIYQHFQDKEAIVEEVIKHELEKLRADMEQIEREADNPIEQMLQASRCLQREMNNVNPVLLFDIKKYCHNGWELFQSHKHEHVIKSVRRNLEKGIQQGLYREDLNVDLMARLHIEQIELVFDPTVFPINQYNPVEVKTQVLHHFLRGLLTEKGFQLYNQYVDQSVIEAKNQ